MLPPGRPLWCFIIHSPSIHCPLSPNKAVSARGGDKVYQLGHGWGVGEEDWFLFVFVFVLFCLFSY